MPAKLSKCFRCGSEGIEDRPVEELVRRGQDVVALRFSANVCSNCGERYFERDHVTTIEDVRRRLEHGFALPSFTGMRLMEWARGK